jgi:hypothetical protein
MAIFTTWAFLTTGDLQIALANGYIGQVTVVPKPVASAVHAAVTGRRLPSWQMYYYGKQAEHLRALFGYD